MNSIQDRFPKREELLSVLSFTALVVFGRMLYVFSWKVPSWINYLNVGEILSELSYALTVSLFETLFYVAVLALIAFALPSRWLRDAFAIRGIWGIAVWLGSWIVYFSRMASLGMELGFSVLNYLYPWLAVTLVLMLVAALLATHIRFMTRAALWLADRTLVFLYLVTPASLIGLIVVLVRNSTR
jgi:hypothetical protein